MPGGPLTSSASGSDVADTVFSDMFKGAMARLGTFGLYAGSLLAFLTAVTKLRAPLEDLLGTKDPRVIVGVATLPLFASLLFDAVPAMLRRWHDRRLARGVVQPIDIRPGFFLTRPFLDTESDKRSFVSCDYVRDDRSHEIILSWVTSSSLPVMFLTGRSGCGKTSLLNAFVLPTLRSIGGAPWLTITVRSFNAPLEFLTQQLVNANLLTEDEIAEPSPVEINLCKAANRLGTSRLLIVFDQFEEALILPEDASRTIGPIEDLVAFFLQKPLQSIRFVFVIRSDYIGPLQSHRFPPLEQHVNWMEVSPFTETAARKFLMRSGLEISDGLLDDLLRQAVELEETPGLIRPITINMLGLALDRLGKGDGQVIERGPRIGGILTIYVQVCLRFPEIKEHARAILQHMTTDAGTKRPVTVDHLARLTNLPPAVVMGCLLHLQSAGIVRRLDQSKERWEIAHDFIARLINYVLANWKRTFVERVRPWIAPVSLLLWATFFLCLWPQLQNWQTNRTITSTYSTFDELDVAVSKEIRLRHLFVPPESYYAIAALVSDVYLPLDAKSRAEDLLAERGFAVRLFSFYEATFFQWQRAIRSHNSEESQFLEKTLQYFNNTLLRNPRMLYYWRKDGGGISEILDPATNTYYDLSVLHNLNDPLIESPDDIGPFH